MGVRALAASALVLASGCFWTTTKHEGNVMREQIKNLDARLKTQEGILEGRVKQLDESIDKATKILARNSADLGTQVDTFSAEMAQFAGRLEALTRTLEATRTELAEVKKTQTDLAARLDNLERGLGIRPAGPGSQPTTAAPVDRDALYASVATKMQAGQYADARSAARIFLQAFPDDARAANANLLVAETFAREKDYAHAIAEYQKVVDGFPKSELVDDAFLAAGQAALDGKLCLEANAYFGELVRRFPKSPLARTAKTKLAYVKKNTRNEKVCKKY
jgi:TolA-binding protein